MAHLPFGSALFWPMMAAMSASEATSAFVHQMARMTAADVAMRPEVPPPEWATPNRLTLELPTLLLHDFSAGRAGKPTLICAPYALHGATVADFAPGHSLVEVLQAQGRANLHLVEWRSATPQMRLYGIDTLLADFNVAVDEFGGPVDLIGLCQGGWMALVYAARFPAKVRRLVIAGAPIDLAAADSGLSRLATRTPIGVFAELLKEGDGRLLGQMMLDLWGPAPTETDASRRELQIEVADPAAPLTPAESELHDRFRKWYDWTVDLPGIYYLEVVQWLYKENRLAQGTFFALGRRIDLAQLRMPLLLLAGRDDQIIAPAQVLSAADLVGTPPDDLKTLVAPSSHLGLFMGRDTLARFWPEIVAWLDRPQAS